jgi:uncharacterized protein
MIDVSRLKDQIDRVCQELPIRRLGLFGSAMTEDFDSASDVDVLVVFEDESKEDLFERYFELKERLEKIFGREVGLVVDGHFRNPVFRDSVERTRTVIYER